MRKEGGYFIWNKGDRGSLSPHFFMQEFVCHCTYPECVEQRISEDLIERLDVSRDHYGDAILVTNGYRCKRHQKDLTSDPNVETVKNSQHVLGNAVDIEPVTKLHMAIFPLTLNMYFKAIGTGLRGFHVDTRDDKMRRWTYSKGL